MNLVLWGHEHECRIKQERIEDLRQTFITQPGSSVATSLCAGEAVDKHVAILKINRRKFRIEPIKLETVRPMVLKDIMVKDVFESLKMKKNATAKERSQALEKYIEGVVEGLIRDAEDKLTNHPKQPTKPLVRVRIFHDDVEDSFNPVRYRNLSHYQPPATSILSASSPFLLTCNFLDSVKSLLKRLQMRTLLCSRKPR